MNTKELYEQFELNGELLSCEPHGNGHINDTFLLECTDGRYILQGMNTNIFKNIEGLMSNVIGVTGYLRERIIAEGGDPERETLNFIPAKNGKYYVTDENGGAWRICRFIEDSYSYEAVEEPEQFCESGKGFGHFQYLLADYPADTLVETIPDFHNSPKRFKDFLKALNEDKLGRAAACKPEIDFILAHESDLGAAQTMLEAGELPFRVTHNDTKLNNVRIDKETGKAICVIDLDTVMPGLSIFDFGDAIRFGANTALEDEVDQSKIGLSLELFEQYVKGYLEGCQGSLTEAELRMLPMGAKIMTLECGMRFLTDYLAGDVYFKIAREQHNLDRTRTQFGLVADMERKWQQMEDIVAKYI